MLTFRHQTVYDPRSKQAVPLLPFRGQEKHASFRGDLLPPETAQQIAEAVIHPVTHEPFLVDEKNGEAKVVRPPSRLQSSMIHYCKKEQPKPVFRAEERSSLSPPLQLNVPRSISLQRTKLMLNSKVDNEVPLTVEKKETSQPSCMCL